MAVFEIPLIAAPQKFVTTLAGVQYQLLVRWNVPANVWTLDISDENDVPMACGVPLVTGADLLAQYQYLNIGGQLICQTDHDVNTPPAYDNLGATAHLYFVTS